MRSVEAGTMSRFRSFGGWLSLTFGLLFTAIGLWLAVGGFRLMALGGSFYYSIAGTALAGDARCGWRRAGTVPANR